MGNFLKENWIWIVAPVAVVVIAVVALLLMTEGDPANDFVYHLR